MSAFERTEALDDRAADPATATRNLRDITVTNTLFGGRQAVRWGLTRLLRGVPPDQPLTLLDVGAGAGDIADYLRRAVGWTIQPLALDHLPCAAAMCGSRNVPAAVADLYHPPVAPNGVDLVIVSQVLHHLPRPAIPPFLRGLSAMARLGVVVADLRRSRLARAGIWTASHLLGFHPVTRIDGVTSVGKGFTQLELDQLCRKAGAPAFVQYRPGWRVVAGWRT